MNIQAWQILETLTAIEAADAAYSQAVGESSDDIQRLFSARMISVSEQADNRRITRREADAAIASWGPVRGRDLEMITREPRAVRDDILLASRRIFENSQPAYNAALAAARYEAALESVRAASVARSSYDAIGAPADERAINDVRTATYQRYVGVCVKPLQDAIDKVRRALNRRFTYQEALDAGGDGSRL